MSPLLARLLTHTPAIVKRQALVQLFQRHSRSVPMPICPGCPGYRGSSACWRMPGSRRTRPRRRFARVAISPSCRSGLYRNAYRLGRTPGWLLRVPQRRRRHGARPLSLRHPGHRLPRQRQRQWHGEITISRCYFSSFYSPEVCRVMSAMDRGLLAGLAGGGELVFIQRITEGQPCCRARFALAGSPSSARPWQEQTR